MFGIYVTGNVHDSFIATLRGFSRPAFFTVWSCLGPYAKRQSSVEELQVDAGFLEEHSEDYWLGEAALGLSAARPSRSE